MRQSAARRLGEKGFKRRGRGRKEVERKAAEEADPLDRAGSAEAESSSTSGPRPEGEHARNIDMHFELDSPERSAIERAIQREQQHQPAGSLKLTQREQSPDHFQTSALDLPSEAEEQCDSPKNEQRKSRFRALVEKKYGDSSLTAIDLATTHKQKSKFHLEGWNYAPTNKARIRLNLSLSMPPMRRCTHDDVKISLNRKLSAGRSNGRKRRGRKTHASALLRMVHRLVKSYSVRTPLSSSRRRSVSAAALRTKRSTRR